MKTQTNIIEVNHEDLVNLFSTAFYGSTYLSVEYDDSQIENDEDDCHEDSIAKVLLSGGTIKVTDHYAEGSVYGDLPHDMPTDEDEEGNVVYYVTLEAVKAGLAKAINGNFNTGENDSFSPDWVERQLSFAHRSFYAFAYDDREWDLTTADCLMQIILFNEIIYG